MPSVNRCLAGLLCVYTGALYFSLLDGCVCTSQHAETYIAAPRCPCCVA